MHFVQVQSIRKLPMKILQTADSRVRTRLIEPSMREDTYRNNILMQLSFLLALSLFPVQSVRESI